MSVTLPVYALGFGDYYAHFFEGVAMVVGSTGFAALLRCCVLLGGVCTLGSVISQRQHGALVRWVGMYVLLGSVLLLPAATVIVCERAKSDLPVARVRHVPVGLAVLASFTSRLGAGTAELFDTVWHLPDSLTYSRTGMLFGAQLVDAVHAPPPLPEGFRSNLQRFTRQCVFYDVLQGKYTLDDLVHSPDIWGLVSEHASPARAFRYNDTVVTCQRGVVQLTRDWAAATDTVLSRWARQVLPGTQAMSGRGHGDDEGGSHGPPAKAQLLAYLNTSYPYLMQLSSQASQTLQQQMMIQVLGTVSPHGATAPLAALAFTQAQAQKRQAYQLLFSLAVHWLPLMKTAIELILYGAFVLVAP